MDELELLTEPRVIDRTLTHLRTRAPTMPARGWQMAALTSMLPRA